MEPKIIDLWLPKVWVPSEESPERKRHYWGPEDVPGKVENAICAGIREYAYPELTSEPLHEKDGDYDYYPLGDDRRLRVNEYGEEKVEIKDDSIASIAFGGQFAKVFDPPKDRNNVADPNYAVLAMMGGILPMGQGFFRWGISAALTGAVMRDQILKKAPRDDKGLKVSPHIIFVYDAKEKAIPKFRKEPADADDAKPNGGLGKSLTDAFYEQLDSHWGKSVVEDAKKIHFLQPGTTPIPSTVTEETIGLRGGYEELENVIMEDVELVFKQAKEEGKQPHVGVILFGRWQEYTEILKHIIHAWVTKISGKECNDKRLEVYVDSNYIHNPVLDKKYLNGEVSRTLVRIHCYTGRLEKVKNKLDKGKDEQDDERDEHTKELDEGVEGRKYQNVAIFERFAKESIRLCIAGLEQMTSAEKSKDRRKSFYDFLFQRKFHQTTFGAINFRGDGELFLPVHEYVAVADGRQYEHRGEVAGGAYGVADVTYKADLLSTISHYVTQYASVSIDRHLNLSPESQASKSLERCAEGILQMFGELKDSKCAALQLISQAPGTIQGAFFSWNNAEKKRDNRGEGSEAAAFRKLLLCLSKFQKDQVRPIAVQISLAKNLNNSLSNNDTVKCYFKAKNAVGGIKRFFDVLPDKKELDKCGDATCQYRVFFSESRQKVRDFYEVGKKDKLMSITLNGDEFQEIRSYCAKKKWSGTAYIYCIPFVLKKRNGDPVIAGWCVLFGARWLSLYEIEILKSVVTHMFQGLFTARMVTAHRIVSVKAAVGSIMSRNGSHNIGSHVLASLSHNVGTMPDDRVLYQYIQHRMDYIATATTEAPRWTQPTMLVASMMKEFLRQKHLLDHISGSEGLHAYKFQGHSAGDGQENTIRVHVRRIKPTESSGLKDADWREHGFFGEGQASVTEFIRYPNEGNGEVRVDFSQDVAVAIPGGVVGQHAFYTILENVLRNAAKHEWSQMIESARRGHLNLYVDFVDQPEKGSVACRVWTECVQTDEVRSGADGKARLQSVDADLLKHMEEKIASSFVNDGGELKKENWGIAEMRISAGYLRSCDIADVAGLVTQDSALKIIQPVLVDKQCLGYCFEINKPKELLVVLNDATACKIVGTSILDEANNVLAKVNANALQYGVEFQAASKVRKAVANSYSYVLFEDSDRERIAELLASVPFRTLTSENGYEGTFFAAVDLVEKFKEMGESKEYARVTCSQLLEDVYAGWLKYISVVRYGGKAERPLRLAIDIEGEANSSGGRQSLVSDHDLIRFVFEHSFNAAVRSFLSNENGKGISTECAALLDAVSQMKQRRIASYRELAAYGNNKPVDGITADEENRVAAEVPVLQIVLWQLGLWLSTVLGTGTLRDFYGRDGNWGTIVRFAEYICSTILSQAESFLRKYEEDISTVPQGFSVKPNSDTGVWTWEGGVSVEFMAEQKEKNAIAGTGAFCYFRHGERTFERFTAGYYEALSGAQSELNALVSYKHDVQYVAGAAARSDPADLDVALARNRAARFTARLAENAILRLLIIDERVKKFMDDHDNVRRMLPGLGIAVLDHDSPETHRMFLKEDDAGWESIGRVMIGDMTLADFEVVIIHQGVIDKLLVGHENKTAVRTWLRGMEKNLVNHYIVITTGRGSPANIPEDARVLPYSVIESSILQRYPEKMILVDTLMNLLPTGRRS